MRSVVTALCEELVRVKDSLDLFVRSDRSGVAELDSLLPPLKQIACTLWTRFSGRSNSVSRVPGPPPRTSTPATAPRGVNTTVVPVSQPRPARW